ncbi:MAG: tRNA-dihydrouridine synthase family protein [Verrucomicrobia bacterium]|nr:MAG: tRNA-dihydrouridine synthase family protein [Verrucomicrobiota bacterium]
MRDFLRNDRPALVLAPMQDVTDLPFMRVLARRGAPDWFVTEYFRVHPDSKLNPYILRSITENKTGRPIFAQMIGRDVECLVRTAQDLQRFPIAGIDLNLGCPAPIVCRKEAGGGLLRHPAVIDEIIGRLREVIDGRFTVKTRLGYYAPDEFSELLNIFQRHAIDGLTIHSRTVHERYQSPVHPEWVNRAVQTLQCPVIANGNIVDLATARATYRQTSANGLMIGRGAIRNPWIFSQIIASFLGTEMPVPSYRDLWQYIEELYQEIAMETPKFIPLAHVQRMKKTLAYISHGLTDRFEYEMRRAKTPDEFHSICRDQLDHDAPLPAQPPNDSKLFCGFAELLETADHSQF